MNFSLVFLSWRKFQRKIHINLQMKLPLCNISWTLGSSRPAALRRFRANKRKLNATEGHWEEFCCGLDEYIEMDHAELVPKEDLDKPDKDRYYLPMHGVRKESSSTTRLRIMFDASAKTSSGHSLNDQLTGPSLYP